MENIGQSNTFVNSLLEHTVSFIPKDAINGTRPSITLNEYIEATHKSPACNGLKYGKEKVRSHCGGVIVKDESGVINILSAAHCFYLAPGVNTASNITAEMNKPACDLMVAAKIDRSGRIKEVYECESIKGVGGGMDADLALMTIKTTANSTPPKTGVEFATTEELLETTTIYAVGFPLGIGPKFTKGKLLDTEGHWHKADMAALNKFSGSPIFNDKGKLIGVVRGRSHTQQFSSGNKDFELDEEKSCFKYRSYDRRPDVNIFNPFQWNENRSPEGL
jgi:hypothetical protein